MKVKTAITSALLLFVAASVILLGIKEFRGRPAGPVARQQAGPPGKKVLDGVIVYYFHGDVRCTTCLTIEAYAREAVESGFAEELKKGRLEWRAVNVDRKGNEHFVRDFQLATRSVVLERLEDGRRKDWRNLQRVWELVMGDRETFVKYVRDETKAFLDAAGK
jgi:hypothetical protein